MKIRTGDTVKILSGKDKGKKAKVISVFPREEKILVEGINLKKRHRKSRREDKKGEIVLLPAPFPVSVAALVCPACGKATRVGFRKDDAGEKHRICKKCQSQI